MIIDLSHHLKSQRLLKVFRRVAPAVHKALGFDELNALYVNAKEHCAMRGDGGTLFGWLDSALEVMRHTYEVNNGSEFDLPANGPLVVVANHPFGFIDPLVLGHLISFRRSDLMIMANSMLGGIPELKPFLIEVNPFGTPGAAQENLGAMKRAIRHLRNGGAMIVFPSGEVAHYRVGHGVEESAWSEHAGALVRCAGAAVLPVFFPGRKSVWFHASGLVSKYLRTGLIVREFLRSPGGTTSLVVGPVQTDARLREFGDDRSLTQHLRDTTLGLKAPSLPKFAGAQMQGCGAPDFGVDVTVM